jgi:ABC-type cobalamin transport system permease subunit
LPIDRRHSPAIGFLSKVLGFSRRAMSTDSRLLLIRNAPGFLATSARGMALFISRHVGGEPIQSSS